MQWKMRRYWRAVLLRLPSISGPNMENLCVPDSCGQTCIRGRHSMRAMAHALHKRNIRTHMLQASKFLYGIRLAVATVSATALCGAPFDPFMRYTVHLCAKQRSRCLVRIRYIVYMRMCVNGMWCYARIISPGYRVQ